jgi:hypothetical protein
MFRAIGEAIGRRAAKDAVDNMVASGEMDRLIRGAVDKILAKPEYAWFHFAKLMQAEMLRVDPTMTPKDSFHRARDALFDFLKEEKIQFGAPGYDWTPQAARELAHELEIRHWEGAPG